MKGIRNFLVAAVCVMLTVCFARGAAFPTARAVEAPDPEPTAAGPQALSDDDMYAYLFVHFVGTEGSATDEQIYFSVSVDGVSWATLNKQKPVLTSTVGEKGVRDPNIIRKPDGSGYYVIATDLSIYELGLRVGNDKWGYSQTNGSRHIVVWESKGDSLTEWNEPRWCEIARENATCTWAPEVIWDDERKMYMVYWASKTKEDWYHRVYRCYTSDFETFTAPEVYIEAEESRIDTTFIKDGGTYYRFTKDESKTYVYMEKSDSLSGDFTAVRTYRLNGRRHTEFTGYEGPTIYKLNGEDKWCLLLDNYGTGSGYKPFVTEDLSKGEFVSARAFNFGGLKFRHGTVMPITKGEYDALMASAWGDGVTFPQPIDPSEGDPTTGKVVYSLDFEGENKLASGVEGTAAATEQNGSVSFVEGYKGGNAVKFDLASNKGPGAYLKLPGEVLAGKKAMTITFAAKIDDVETGIDEPRHVNWLFLASASDLGCVYNNEQYMAGLWQRGDSQIVAQRWNNKGSRAPVPSVGSPAAGSWAYITIVYVSSGTNVYIDGAFAGSCSTSVSLEEILGDSPVFYLGHSTWGSGEGSTATLDDFAVYDYALSADEVAGLYSSVKAA